MLNPQVFTKMTATGNDFILVHPPVSPLTTQQRAALAIQLCHRTQSVGADGLIFLEHSGTPSADLAWDFYNADGSHAEMCGNAARCVTLFAQHLKLAPNPLRLKTGAGVVLCHRMDEQRVSVTMPLLTEIRTHQSLLLESRSIPYFFLNSGVPHAVFNLDSLSEWSDVNFLLSRKIPAEVKAFAQRIQSHNDFGPRETNVTLYRPQERGIFSISFERGVKDFTQSCGTGAVAAAYVHSQLQGVNTVDVRVPGGQLKVEFTSKDNPALPTLTGAADFVAEFKLYV
jgi:diaminopimelate epimerase